MGSGGTEQDLHALRRRAEQALRAAKPRDYLIRVLEQLASAASGHRDAARFAHRHLAELRLEESPWHAALHLRRVLQLDPHDDVAHAMMGLCLALQANYRAAVAHYRRSVQLQPTNPWYLHNLGHLLDVALDAPRDAVGYLRRAHALQSGQREVTASLSRCLGRLGKADEALELLAGVSHLVTHDADLRSLERWLRQGCPPERMTVTPALIAPTPPTDSAAAFAGRTPNLRAELLDPGAESLDADEVLARTVEQMLVEHLHASRDRIARGLRLWRDFRGLARPMTGRAAAYAAAVEYALGRIDGRGATQREIAARHHISASSLQARYGIVRDVLRLTAFDPRYAPINAGSSPQLN